MRAFCHAVLVIAAAVPSAHAAGPKAAGKVAGKAVFAAPADSPPSLLFADARDYCDGLAVLGHMDWRLPDMRELALLHHKREAIGGFASAGDDDPLSYLAALSEQAWGGAYYWSSEQEESQGLGMDFATGKPIRLSVDGSGMPNRASARCVRTAR